jgi:hypothetical protein
VFVPSRLRPWLGSSLGPSRGSARLHNAFGRSLGPPHRRRRGLPLDLRLRLALARHRRVVVAVLLGLAVAAALASVQPEREPTASLLVAARDLPAGHRLTADDLDRRAWPRDAAPAGLLPRPQGRVLAAPLRRGEPVTDIRVTPSGSAALGRGRLTDGRVAVTVRLADPAASLLVTPGDHVQVIAGAAVDAVGGEASAPARVVVPDALILSTPATRVGTGTGTEGGSSGGGLLGGLAPGRGAATPDVGSDSGIDGAPSGGAGGDGRADGGLPAGVLALGVRPDDALGLAAVSGVRALSIARQFSVSS